MIIIIIDYYYCIYIYYYNYYFTFLMNTIKFGQKSIAHEKRRRVNDWKSIKFYCS